MARTGFNRIGAGKETAAAAAVAGVAAAGAKLAYDKLTDGSEPESAAFRLEPGEDMAVGVPRIARGQVDKARLELRQRDADAAVHQARKRLKRLRALLRLARPALASDTYTSESTLFRDAGRQLSGPRDAAVLVETLDRLVEQSSPDLSAAAVASLRQRLAADHAAQLAVLRKSGAVRAVHEELAAAHARTAQWEVAEGGFESIGPGLRRVYRRGRRRMQAAAKQPDGERLHEWRKRVKDLWHAAEILEPAQPKRMGRLAERAHELSKLLGDDHDLFVLREFLGTHGGYPTGEARRQEVLESLEQRRLGLQAEAFALGEKVYAKRPKRFVRRIERDWLKQAAAVAAPDG